MPRVRFNKGRAGAFVLRLYVAGAAPHSAQALANLHAICKQHVDHKYEIEIVDVVRNPERALSDGILVTPTLVKLYPAPIKTIVGDLSGTLAVVQALGIGVRGLE